MICTCPACREMWWNEIGVYWFLLHFCKPWEDESEEDFLIRLLDDEPEED